MMRGYILDIPRALEESALVDGCTRWQVIWKVVFRCAGQDCSRLQSLPSCRVERLHFRAGADAHRGRDLHGAGYSLLWRPVELLGQDLGDVGAGTVPIFIRGGVHAAYLVRGISLGAVKG